MITSGKLNLRPQSVLSSYFRNQEYRFTNLKSWARLAKKLQQLQEEVEHRKLQSVMWFPQMHHKVGGNIGVCILKI